MHRVELSAECARLDLECILSNTSLLVSTGKHNCDLGCSEYEIVMEAHPNLGIWCSPKILGHGGPPWCVLLKSGHNDKDNFRSESATCTNPDTTPLDEGD